MMAEGYDDAAGEGRQQQQQEEEEEQQGQQQQKAWRASGSTESGRSSPPSLPEQAPAGTHQRRRLSARTRHGGGGGGGGARQQLRRAWRAYIAWSEALVAAYQRLSPRQRALAVAACAVGWVLLVLMLVYSHRFFAWLAPYAQAWRQRPGGWLLVFALVFATAFPPLFGYSTATTVAGFVYGFPLGWLLAAAACVAGGLAAFLASRTVLSRCVDAMVGKDHRFVALGQVLRREGILYLTAIRFCPLPFSLSNGFLATIPSISPLAFTLATALSSPKLLVHVFIGSRLAILADKGDSMTAGDKAINYLSMVLGGAVGLAVGWAIYRRTMARAAELACEEAPAAAADDVEAGYQDTDAMLLDPEDAAAVMSDDDVSLWDARDAAAPDEAPDNEQDAKKHHEQVGHGRSR